MSTANHQTEYPGRANTLAPRFVSKADAVRILGSLKLVERMLYASYPGKPNPWLRVVPVRPGTKHRHMLIDLTSVHQAADRLLTGETPPLFPSELKARTSRKNKRR